MIKNFNFTNIFIDCDKPEELCEFYHQISGWEKSEQYGLPLLTTSLGMKLYFQQPDVKHLPPVWPDTEKQQQKQVHFDFSVENLQEAAETALSFGATIAPKQYGGDLWITLFDPAGHPFDLYEEH